MRGEDESLVIDPMRVRFCAVFLVVEFRDGRLLENMAPLPWDRGRERGEILSRMKLSLVRETHAGRLHLRNAVEIRRIKPELVRQARILAETFTLVLRSAVDRRMQVSGNASELALDRLLPNQLFDLIDG